jgi:hypothetical protein
LEADCFAGAVSGRAGGLTGAATSFARRIAALNEASLLRGPGKLLRDRFRLMLPLFF